MHRMPQLGLILLFVIALLLAVFVTGPKLWKMCQIKGWLSGATATTETITQMWQEESRRVSRDDVYWVSWAKGGDRSTHRDGLNLERDEWAKLRVGDAIEVVRVPGDELPYLRNGIFVETGNFVFDVVLLSLEVGAAAVVAVLLVRSRRRAE